MHYHPGEIQVQERAGVRDIAARKNNIYSEIPLAAKTFLESQPFLILGAADDDGAVWASVWFGTPGFIKVEDSQHAIINGLPDSQDPFSLCLYPSNPIAAIAVDFATRRRMRLNGRIGEIQPNGFQVRAEQVYSNCPKYIQAREWTLREGPSVEPVAQALETLSEEVVTLVNKADTFFIATQHLQYGTDVSHRGGMPGFVRAEDDRTLVFPDYSGNAMFNTLGNAVCYPQAGLLFMDFDSGSLIQLTGTVEILWDVTPFAHWFQDAQRIIRFHLERGIITSHAMSLSWRTVQYSPANPSVVVES